ncbi:unnamed protein product [Prorocentrum cordatum]|uniref:Ion transport domain-containing protein n=1 Tax=Prorocentrum cordatum TaxID=2364126 RepID=A0ABN9WVK0_9DINO|nr:unnamed protein product [Polarella glacialis]
MSTSIYRVVRTPLFELLFGGLILLNTIVMGLEEQWSGAQVGYTLGFYTFYGSEQMGEDAPIMSADSLFLAAEITFAILFTIEVFLRIAASGFLFFSSPSACFDLAVVVASDMSIIFSSIDLSINIQILRLLRAVKLLRLVKLMRTVEGFDPLHIMMTALGASAWALCWAIVLLVLIQTFVAMIVTHVFRLAYLQESSSLSDDAQLELFAYFGTFSRSMLSLFELSLANWPPICRWLMENLHESFMLFALTFKLM